MKIARVFSRKTKASPADALAFYGPPPQRPPEVDEVYVSSTFTFASDEAFRLAEAWQGVAPVTIGGPAVGTYPRDFVPGMFLKKGYVITSRGCPNHCWFCKVPEREGGIRELPITEGHNLLDSNILACSMGHIRKVFAMLKQQDQKAVLSGGLEAARLTRTLTALLWDLRPDRMYFAYDTPNDLEPLRVAGNLLREADFTRRHLNCYVLIGHKKDTVDKAERRLVQAWDAGFMPMAMLYRDDKTGQVINEDWQKFQRLWARPAIIRSRIFQKRIGQAEKDLNSARAAWAEAIKKAAEKRKQEERKRIEDEKE